MTTISQRSGLTFDREIRQLEVTELRNLIGAEKRYRVLPARDSLRSNPQDASQLHSTTEVTEHFLQGQHGL